jgi:hypothetical protein
MRAVIGSNLLSSAVAQPRKRPFEIYDSRLFGFTLRVQPSGVRSYYARFGRGGGDVRLFVGCPVCLLMADSDDALESLKDPRTRHAMVA